MPPTFDATRSFEKDYAGLGRADRARFRKAVSALVEDLKHDRRPRPGLRIKGVRGAPGVLEMTWAPDGRATFEFGTEVRRGEPHVVWRRIGTHEVFRRP